MLKKIFSQLIKPASVGVKSAAGFAGFGSAFTRVLAMCVLLLSICTMTMAQQLPEPMKPARLVNDFAGVLTPAQQSTLEQKLVDFDRSTSTQIAVVSVPDLEGAAISDYAARLFDKWGVGGSSQKNNGLLILVKPKTADSKGEVFIATGYGVEGAVPDALAGRIVDYDILPSFREGRFYEGIDRATSTLMSLTKGEFTADQYLKRKEKQGSGAGSIIGLVVLFFVISLLSSRSKVGSKHTISSGGDVATAILLGSLLSGGRGHGGGGGFGGFSGGGGGFGGFGGGFSGGGGAGGSW